MTIATKRATLRWIHIICTIPVLGYIYDRPSNAAQYASAVRFTFVPILILSGYWMYAGLSFAIIGAAAWIGANYFSGYWMAVLSQLVLLVGRKIWLMNRARSPK
jgi:hypothetical protein